MKKMDIAIMISKNNKTSDSHRLNSSDKINLKRSDKYCVHGNIV